MTRRIATAIDVDAPAAAIWRVLIDFPAYPEWNPFIRRIVGEARVGARLEVTAQPAGRKPMTFRPTVRVADPDRGLLVPAFAAMLDDTARSFAEFNAALKRRVEGA